LEKESRIILSLGGEWLAHVEFKRNDKNRSIEDGFGCMVDAFWTMPHGSRLFQKRREK
jgi:hypothetical protein